MKCLLALLLLCPSALPAEQNIEAVETNRDDALAIERMEDSLRSDDAAAEAAAERISRSSLARIITEAEDPKTRLVNVRKWVAMDPRTAAKVAVGLAKDDAAGVRHFEDILGYRMGRHNAVDNPNAKNNVFGRLKKSSADSKLLKMDENISNEERQEIIKNLFEGKGASSQKVLGSDDRKFSNARETGSATSAMAETGLGFYDRLSQGNLTGYSPHVMAIQSALNARRAPGTPKLIETGKLDYETLVYPSHGMRYDFKNLEQRLRREEKLILARLAGTEKSPRAPALSAREREALSRRLEKRSRALLRLKAALADFTSAAEKSKDPAHINRQLLLSLSQKQKEAARWITIASLEEELQNLENQEDFLTPELAALIDAAPFPPAPRAAYKQRGLELKKNLDALRGNAESTLKTLEAPAWTSHLPRIDATLSQSALLRKGLGRDIQNFTSIPYRLRWQKSKKSNWRRQLESLIIRLIPSSSYARRLRDEEKQFESLRQAFARMAAGEFDAAEAALTSGR